MSTNNIENIVPNGKYHSGIIKKLPEEKRIYYAVLVLVFFIVAICLFIQITVYQVIVVLGFFLVILIAVILLSKKEDQLIREEKTSPKNHPLKKILADLKQRADVLLKTNFDEGKDEIYNIRSELKALIRRIYHQDYEKIEKELIGTESYSFWNNDSFKDTIQKQKWFIEDVKKLIRAINIILLEEEQFGLKDFKRNETIKK